MSNDISQELREALALAAQGQTQAALSLLETQTQQLPEDPEAAAVLYTTLALLHRQQGQLERAWLAYQTAERILPNDLVLQLIIARFLLLDRDDYAGCLRRLKNWQRKLDAIPSFAHQTHTLMGLAYLRQGKSKPAIKELEQSMHGHFAGIISSDNIDFRLVEALISAELAETECRHFIEAAYDLARQQQDFKNMTKFRQILDSFEPTQIS